MLNGAATAADKMAIEPCDIMKLLTVLESG